MQYDDLRELARLLKAISHPIRLDILFILGELEEQSISSLESLVETSKQDLTRHIKILEQAGIIERRRVGRKHALSLRSKYLLPILKAIQLKA